MKLISRACSGGVLPCVASCALLYAGVVAAQTPGGASGGARQAAAQAAAEQGLPSETPEQFVLPTEGLHYVERDVMIPMRDGVKLHTVILVPKGAAGAPLLTRTPYDATELTHHAASVHLGPMLQGYDNATDLIVEGGYIRVVQAVRGKYGSEGGYVMNRPLRGPLNPSAVDHSTDTWDTIESPPPGTSSPSRRGTVTETVGSDSSVNPHQ